MRYLRVALITILFMSSGASFCFLLSSTDDFINSINALFLVWAFAMSFLYVSGLALYCGLDNLSIENIKASLLAFLSGVLFTSIAKLVISSI